MLLACHHANSRSWGCWYEGAYVLANSYISFSQHPQSLRALGSLESSVIRHDILMTYFSILFKDNFGLTSLCLYNENLNF